MRIPTLPSRLAQSRVALATVMTLGFTLLTTAQAAQPGVTQEGLITHFTLPATSSQAAGGAVDYVHAQPLPLPIATNFSPEIAQQELIGQLSAAPRFSLTSPTIIPGYPGDGKERAVFLGAPAKTSSDGDYSSQEAGTTNHPFSTARADGATGATNKTYPFRAAGKLFFTKDGGSYICSASLIGRGLVVTAAHCVSEFGKNRFYTNFKFAPGYRSGTAPYGNWSAQSVWTLTSYLRGTDTCSQKGVVCRNDVALILLAPQGGKFPGTSTGVYGYGFDGYGFTSNNLTHVTQIGYPSCLDNGAIMERNDSQGNKSSANANNTLIGSLMCGGSSGGPWVLNFGTRPTLTSTTSGTSPASNVVIGVTSWGSTSTGPKQQGASPFLKTNISSLIGSACPNQAACL